MRTSRGFARLVGFSDGVVAIAITLLILPLVTAATEIATDIPTFLANKGFQLFLFALSFLVIGRFWVAHHRVYENIVAYNSPLIWANMLWLVSIVFLPFPTQLLGGSSRRDDPYTYALYVGTMAVTTIAILVQQWIIVRTPQLQADEVRGTLRILPYATTAAIMIAALLVATLLPGYGLFALLLLVFTAPIDRLIDRFIERRRKKAA